MKGTQGFQAVVEAHLKALGDNDPLFAETLKKPNKNIKECINYILETVKKSGCNGFADEEIFQMAVHYYDEDNLGKIKGTSARVVVNHSVELSEEDREKARQKAVESLVAEEKDKVRQAKKPAKKQPVEITTLF